MKALPSALVGSDSKSTLVRMGDETLPTKLKKRSQPNSVGLLPLALNPQRSPGCSFIMWSTTNTLPQIIGAVWADWLTHSTCIALRQT